MSRARPLLTLALLALVAGVGPAQATEDPAAARKEERRKAFREATAKARKLEGLLPLYLEEGHLHVLLGEEDFEKQFLVFPSISRGISAGRLLGGMQWGPDDVVLGFRKVQERLFLVRRTPRFQAPEDGPWESVREISYSDSVVRELTVVGEDEAGKWLVRLDPAFVGAWPGIREALEKATGISGYQLAPERSRLRTARAFPENLEIEVELTFQGPETFTLDSIPDGRSVSLGLHFSILSLATKEGEGAYRPRQADDRVGHFLSVHQRLDSTSPDGRFVRYLNRWHLEKADPERERSTVKQPIVFHLSRTIPYEYRPTVRAAILEWKKAFDRIGLLDAIEVRLEGEGEALEAGDVRTHTISFVSEASFNGVGPSRAHPLTGQILDADILYNASAPGKMLLSYPPLGPRDPGAEDGSPLLPEGCAIQEVMRQEMEFAGLHLLSQASAPATPGTTDATGPRIPRELQLAALRKTIIHEVGHILGLRHNFKGTFGVPLEKLHDQEYTRSHGLSASIMDYPTVNLAPPGTPQGEYFPSTLGPYDYWAIEYAYRPFDAEEEEAELAKIAARGAEPGHAYGSDEDRWTGYERNLDPSCQTFDLSDDPLAFARQRHALIRGLWDDLLPRLLRKGDRYATLRYAVRVLLGKIRGTARLALPFVGGQIHHRDHRGDPGERPSFVPVPAARQREALAFLLEGIFADASYPLSRELLERLGPDHHSHWGSEEIGKRIDFPLHGILGRIQGPVLERLLSPRLWKRLLDGERQVPPGQDSFTAAELLATLVEGIFRTPAGEVPSQMRRNLQRRLVHMLCQRVVDLSGEEASDAEALVRLELRRLGERLGQIGPTGERRQRAHLEDLRARIRQALGAERIR